MPSPKNIQQVNSLTSILNDANGVVFLNYQGLTNKQIEEIRNSVEEAGAKLHIAKNTLLAISLRNSNLAISDDNVRSFDEPTAALYLGDDIVTPLKTVTEFAKANTLPTIKGGVIDNQYVDATQVTKIASLPSYDELIAKLIGQIKGPVYGLVSTLNGVNRNLVFVLNQIKVSKGGEQ